tara:strand:- start:14652 stop:15821 length:1170 start_codon:yes stop_codon:yes gene_type:complete
MKKILKLLKANYELRKPPKKNIVFFDINHANFIASKLKIKPDQYTTICSRLERINIYIFIKSLFSNYFNFKFNLFNYYLEFIKYTNAKIVITFTDNNIIFYKFKQYLPHVKFISVQNGHRSENRDWFLTLNKNSNFKKNLKSDIYFTSNKEYGNKINQYINCQIKPIGFFRNNFVSKKTTQKKKTILFISQFRRKEKVFEMLKDANPEVEINQQLIDDTYLVEKKLLPLINQYCVFKKYSFFILGVATKNYKDEKNFYKSIINSNNWKFLKKIKFPKNYRLLDKFENIVFIDSTLGYEAIARDKKVAVFSSRKLNRNGKFEKFGWPLKMKSKGFFYSNSCNYSEVKRVLDNVTNYSDQKWKMKILPKLSKLRYFDMNNTLLKKELRSFK